jgi:uncharacterized protein YbjT (DUF2867 family)
MSNGPAAPRPRRLFVAGSTGATGRTLLRLSGAGRKDILAHRRRKAEGAAEQHEVVFELTDRASLVAALRDCTTVLQLIGTTRKRFATGDTYETSDIGTTRQLVDAAREAGVDHLVLLSSVGAEKPMGAYLKAKAKVESIVRESGIPYTIFRPSAFIGDGHSVPGIVGAMTRMLGLDRYRPIALEDLARALLHVGLNRAPLGEALEGKSLWQVVDASKS